MKPSDQASTSDQPHTPRAYTRPAFLPKEESLSGVYRPKALKAEDRVWELERAVARQRQQLEGMLHISATLRQSTAPDEAMRAIITQISRLLEADRTTIYELNEDKSMLLGVAVQGASNLSVSVPNGRGLAGLVTATKQTLNLADAYEHPSFDVRVDKLTGYRTRSVLCVPLLNVQGEVLGAVQVLNKLTAPHFSREDGELLVALAAQAAITLEALKLEHALKSSNADLRLVSAQAQRQLEEQELLFKVEREAMSADDLSQLAPRVLKRAAQVMEANLVALFVPKEEGYGPAYLQELHPTKEGIEGALMINDQGFYVLPRVDLGEGLLGKLTSRGEALILMGPCFELEALPQALSDRCAYPVQDVLATPLFDDRLPIGVLLFVNCEVLRGYSPKPRRRGDSLFELGSASLNTRQLACFEGVPAEVRERASQRLRLANLIAGQLGRTAAQLARRKSARQKDRLVTIGQMLSGLLHDMRGPMTTISGYSQLMARSQDAEGRAKMAETIKRKVKELNEMTLEVLSFARGERTVLSRKVYLKQFVEHIMESLHSEFEDAEVELKVEGELKGVVFFDEVKIARAVLNIARNAKQAMSHDSERAQPPCFCWLIERLEGGALRFTLRDNGPGIPEVIRGRVFEAFTTSGKAEGTGLGLAIVKRIIDDHEGQIELETATGVGTTFTITLPQPSDSEQAEGR